MFSPNEALRQLQEGNARFSMGLRSVNSLATEERRRALAEFGQSPFAMVLSCADSRVPSELVFDCGLGDLFVVRVAGNVVAPSLIGSLEFAAEKFGTPLCLVMGHTSCGAIQASYDYVNSNTLPDSHNVQMIVQSISPSVKDIVMKNQDTPKEDLINLITDHNVAHSVQELVRQSAVLRQRISEGKLAIVGAKYCLHNGTVEFHDQGAPSDAARQALENPASNLIGGINNASNRPS
jgi:carbonic anhydrase